MKLRHVHPGDTADIVALGRELHASSWYARLDYDPARIAALIDQVIALPTMFGVVLEAADGRIAGFFCAAEAEHIFGQSRYACDIAIYVAPRARGGRGFVRMIRAYETWCRIRGIDEIHLGVSSGLQHSRTVQMFSRLGFNSTATSCRKMCVSAQSGPA